MRRSGRRGAMTRNSPSSLPRVLALTLAFTLATPFIAPATHAQAASASTVYLPNVTKMLGGPDGWQTPFIVQNVGPVPTDLTVSFYSFGDGSLLAQRRAARRRARRPPSAFPYQNAARTAGR